MLWTRISITFLGRCEAALWKVLGSHTSDSTAVADSSAQGSNDVMLRRTSSAEDLGTTLKVLGAFKNAPRDAQVTIVILWYRNCGYWILVLWYGIWPSGHKSDMSPNSYSNLHPTIFFLIMKFHFLSIICWKDFSWHYCVFSSPLSKNSLHKIVSRHSIQFYLYLFLCKFYICFLFCYVARPGGFQGLLLEG